MKARLSARIQTEVVRRPTLASSGPAGDRFATSSRQRPPAAQADPRRRLWELLMTMILSLLLAGVVTYVISGPTHAALGTRFGAFVDLLVYLTVFYFTNRTLRGLRDG